MKAVQSKRKERASGKRVILKGKTIVSTEEVQKALAKVENLTRKRQKAKPRKHKREALGSDMDSEDGEYNAPGSPKDSSELIDGEILDCIEVVL